MSREQKHKPARLSAAHRLSQYLSQETVFSLTTAMGGPIVNVRISGEKALIIFQKLTGIKEIKHAQERKLIFTKIKDINKQVIDEAMACFFLAPHSYTGENTVEFYLHGSSYIVSKLFSELCALGLRQALPGEFSFRAVRNGKMTLNQAEAVADLIASSNFSAHTLALEKISGSLGLCLNEIAQNLKHLAAMGELSIDFSDQDVNEIGLARLKEKIPAIMEKLLQLKNSFERGNRIQDGIPVAFIGLPNAGKSSFFNALLGEDRSIVSEISGTTRDIVKETLALHGEKTSVTLRLMDTAGLRKSVGKVEKLGVQRTHLAGKEAELILLIVDVSISFAALKKEWGKICSPNKKTLGILTKCDLVKEERISVLKKQLIKTFKVPHWLKTSALTGEGISDASQEIVRFCERFVFRDPGEVLLTRFDHLEAVSECIDHLKRATQVQESDLFAADLRHALNSLNTLIGETLPEDILEKIFSEFCIGK
ncbi:MAG: tRNA uridine-5-carboxymethylaminomethyl(34) synthesis GTPase MnmE [Deltaproteobacteria bacterium]|nr:tRNA uridine-5-carboxymethylaminomethyl(34) synthesis GTPase MnmE [Deltaproteobacteria bacterium]